MAKFVYIEHEGKRGTISYWARHFGIPVDVFKMRYRRHGWNLDKLLTKIQKRHKTSLGLNDWGKANELLNPVESLSYTEITYRGVTKDLKEWSAYLDIPYDTLRMRYTRGLRGDELFRQVRRYGK